MPDINILSPKWAENVQEAANGFLPAGDNSSIDSFLTAWRDFKNLLNNFFSYMFLILFLNYLILSFGKYNFRFYDIESRVAINFAIFFHIFLLLQNFLLRNA